MLTIDLSGKTVAVTGASQGIGKAICEVFAESGASLILLARNEEKLKANSQKLKAKYFVLDVSNPQDVENVFGEIGHVDILVNNAGIFFTSSFIDMDIKKWKELLEINLNGAMYCSKTVIKSMIEKKYGRVINISSVSGKVGEPYASAYSVSKFGLIGLTQSLAQELAEHNVTVNAICPGWVETKMAENILHDENYANLVGMPTEKLKSSSLRAVPIGRYIHPKEVAYLALYLASDYASAITGQSINICGGLIMH